MLEVLKTFINGLSTYDIIANILPGTVLCVFLQYFMGYQLINENIYTTAIVFYFAGIVNGRIGSLVVEPVLRKLVKTEPYARYIAAEQKDNKISILSNRNNSYRSYASVFLIIIMAYIYENIISVISFVKAHEQLFFIILLFLVFVFSYIKQTKYIVGRIKYNLDTRKD